MIMSHVALPSCLAVTSRPELGSARPSSGPARLSRCRAGGTCAIRVWPTRNGRIPGPATRSRAWARRWPGAARRRSRWRLGGGWAAAKSCEVVRNNLRAKTVGLSLSSLRNQVTSRYYYDSMTFDHEHESGFEHKLSPNIDSRLRIILRVEGSKLRELSAGVDWAF
jgi:hypothetical protein